MLIILKRYICQEQNILFFNTFIVYPETNLKTKEIKR